MRQRVEAGDPQDAEVVIVGAGFSGIGIAIALQRAGIEDFLLVEEADGVGGAWHWNTYPGVGVDIPSFSYQFSFAQRTDWSRVYAPGRELKAYAEDCVDRYGLRDRIRFSTRISAAEFDERENRWTLEADDGSTLRARFLVGATGVLSQPKLPEIEGIEDFAGQVMHTARWDDDAELRGKRVAIIGTGASAVQVIPSIAPDVQRLTVFQRTPIWCLPKLDASIPAAGRLALRRAPGLRTVTRMASQAFVEVTFPLSAHFHRIVPLASAAERVGLAHLRRQVQDPDIRRRLTPRYGLGCKRPSFSNDYLTTFNRPNVALETTAIERVTASGVRCVDGTEHPVDVLILATGFKVFDRGNMPPFRVTGRDGVDLERWWDEHRFQAYEGTSVPGFPNYFMVLGPYGYNGASYFTLIENQARHITRCLVHARERGATGVEVRAEANARYFASVLGRRRHQVFFQPSCADANSYYFDRHGDVPLRPATTAEVQWRSGRFPLDDYRWTTTASDPDRRRPTATSTET